MLRSLKLNCKGTRNASIDWADEFELWKACGESFLSLMKSRNPTVWSAQQSRCRRLEATQVFCPFEGLTKSSPQLCWGYLTGFDSDNGTVFINYTLQQHFHNHKPPIEFTRSRPYEKNDQAYVEQKNFSVVRQFLGYQWLDNPQLDATINAFFAGPWRDYVNLFLPTLKPTNG